MFQQNPVSLIPVLVLAVAPSLIWLFFYLKEDDHPEPRYWIFIAFLMGVALAPLVIFLEMAIGRVFNFFAAITFQDSLMLFALAPFIEETAKYGVIHLALNKNPVLDEPVDGMIYVIATALGFAAIENVFAIFSFISVGNPGYLGATFNFMSARFISAVALHGLASGISGYYFAKFYFIKRDFRLIFLGLFGATAFHGIYNYLISRDGGYASMILTGVVLGAAAALVIVLFNRLKRFKTYQQGLIDNAGKSEI